MCKVTFTGCHFEERSILEENFNSKSQWVNGRKLLQPSSSDLQEFRHCSLIYNGVLATSSKEYLIRNGGNMKSRQSNHHCSDRRSSNMKMRRKDIVYFKIWVIWRISISSLHSISLKTRQAVTLYSFWKLPLCTNSIHYMQLFSSLKGEEKTDYL